MSAPVKLSVTEPDSSPREALETTRGGDRTAEIARTGRNPLSVRARDGHARVAPCPTACFFVEGRPRPFPGDFATSSGTGPMRLKVSGEPSARLVNAEGLRREVPGQRSLRPSLPDPTFSGAVQTLRVWWP